MSIGSFLDRLRGKRAVVNLLPDYVLDSPADWHSGDVAVCVTGPPWIGAETQAEAVGPAAHETLSVVAVAIFEGRQFLVFPGYSGRFSACSFEKLRGDKLEACEPEFIALLKRVRVPASADTHPKNGDVKQAPLVSGAVPSETSADAQPSVASPKRGPIE